MNSIRRALNHVRRTLIFVSLFHVFINTVVLFLIFATITVFTILPLFYATIPAGIYFIPAIFITYRKIKLKDAEEKIPDLEWQLRTAEDNIMKDNEVTQSLNDRVTAKIAHLRSLTLFDGKKVGLKFFGIFGLALLFLFVSSSDFTYDTLKDANAVTGFFNKIDDIGSLIKAKKLNISDSEGDRDIYGDPSVAQPGTDPLLLELTQEQSQPDLSKINDPRNLEFTKKSQAEDIGGAIADSTYEETIKNKKLVKKYFEQLAGE